MLLNIVLGAEKNHLIEMVFFSSHNCERYHYFGAHFTEIRCLAMKKMLKMFKLDGLPRKYAQNVVTQVKLFIMTVKSKLDVQNTNNSKFG